MFAPRLLPPQETRPSRALSSNRTLTIDPTSTREELPHPGTHGGIATAVVLDRKRFAIDIGVRSQAQSTPGDSIHNYVKERISLNTDRPRNTSCRRQGSCSTSRRGAQKADRARTHTDWRTCPAGTYLGQTQQVSRTLPRNISIHMPDQTRKHDQRVHSPIHRQRRMSLLRHTCSNPR